MQACPQMAQVIMAIAARHALKLEQVGAALRLNMPGFDRLCVERTASHCVSVAHYFELNGDLVAEPDVVFFVDAAGDWYPMTISQSLTGWHVCAELNDAGTAIVRYAPQAQRDLAGFAELWAQNLSDQGWLAHGVRDASATGGDNVSD